MANSKKITRKMDAYLRKHKYILDSKNPKRLVYVKHKIKDHYDSNWLDKNYIVCLELLNKLTIYPR